MNLSNSMLMRAGIDFGDADAIADDAVRGAAAALAQDVAGAREGHDVGDGQEIVLVLQVADEFQLVLDLRLDFGGHALGPAAPCAFVGDAVAGRTPAVSTHSASTSSGYW